jgi:SAM-dependent methyltransferase
MAWARRAAFTSRAAVFSAVYSDNIWGGRPGSYYSGGGSEEAFSAAYSNLINGFLEDLARDHVTVVDVGCGDFRVGARIRARGLRYVGVDIVPSLIAHNTREFGSPSVSFSCLDIVEETPPDGDVCLVRQVFQHLSNDDIARALERLRKYPYVFVTEHRPAGTEAVVPNRDIRTGSAIRMTRGSGVYLDRPPFALDNVRTVLEGPAGQDGVLVTVLLESQKP